MIIQHLFPVFALILLGVILKQRGLTDARFLATTDRLIYYIFFPAMLFWKIGTADQRYAAEALPLFLAAACAVGTIYLLSTLYILIWKVPARQAGSFSQSCYRFNTYVGMAVILSRLGESGVARFGILIGGVIPLINLLAVITLIWFSGQPSHWRARLGLTIRALLTNPLVIGCAAGLLYARWVNTLPAFLENTLRLGVSITLPLALISVGGSLTLKSLKKHLRLATVGSVFKLVLLPLAGYGFMRLFGIAGADRSVGLIFFALPTSTAIYVLSSQLGSDTDLAAAAVVVSTALSFISLAAALGWLHA